MQHECAEVLLELLIGGNRKRCGLQARLNALESGGSQACSSAFGVREKPRFGKMTEPWRELRRLRE